MPDAEILVVGSLNADLIMAVPACPRPGETVIAGAPQRGLGGKGANQAVAAARAGGRVAMVGCVGTDDAGAALLAGLALEGIDVSRVSRRDGPSGTAMVFVAADGENLIVLVPGANAEVTAEALGDQPTRDTKLLVLQLEIPLETIEVAVSRATQRGVPVLLNAAPAHRALPPGVLRGIDVLVVNQHEAETMAGSGDPAELAARLCQTGPRRVVITLGAAGLLWHSAEGGSGRMPAFAVNVVDTTAAGDAFCGALAAQLVRGAAWVSALRVAAAAGALAVTRAGAQSSLPRWHEIERLLTTEQDSQITC